MAGTIILQYVKQNGFIGVIKCSNLISLVSWQLCSEMIRPSWTTVCNPLSHQRT